MIHDTCVIAIYFNPANYYSREFALNEFLNNEFAGVDRFIIGIDFKSEPSDYIQNFGDRFSHIITLNEHIWPREFAINQFVQNHLDKKYRKLIIVDADISWTNSNWFNEMSILLDKYRVVQGYRQLRILDSTGKSTPNLINSFRYKNPDKTKALFYRNDMGGIWGIHRSLWEDLDGLFDKYPHPNANELHAAAFHGKPMFCGLAKTLPENSLKEYVAWAQRISSWTNSEIGFIDQEINHKWHHIAYREKNIKLASFLNYNKFDPAIDLDYANYQFDGINKEFYQSRYRSYFVERQDDGDIKYLKHGNQTIPMVPINNSNYYRTLEKSITTEFGDTPVKSIQSHITFRKRVLSLGNKTAWIVPFFSFTHNPIMRDNFRVFYDALGELNKNVFVIELACFEDSEFSIPESSNFIRIKPGPGTLLWQKERLLNLALSQIPKDYANIVWADADILFQDTNHLQRDIDLKLQDYSIVHLFKTVSWLNPDRTIRSTFRSVVDQPAEHFGHPGYAWAARREELDPVGFFDYHITGNGDTFMYFLMNRKIERWAQPFFDLPGIQYVSEKYLTQVKKHFTSRIGNLDGNIKHLFHGDYKNRNYENRHKILLDNDYDPIMCIRLNNSGLYEFNHNEPKALIIEDLIKQYLNRRKENDYAKT